MKKKNIIIIAIIVVALVCIPIILIMFQKENTENTYYTIKNRHIYLHDLKSVKINYKNETKELKDWLKEDEQIFWEYLSTLRDDKSIKHLSYDDGGTEVFETPDYNIIVCNKIDGNYNIHIGKNIDIHSNGVCSMPIVENLEGNEKSFRFHLGHYLEQLLVSPGEETKLKEVSLDKLIDVDLKSVEYSRVMQHSKEGTYVIIKTNNQEVITKLETYFKEKYKEYQKTSLDHDYKVLIANKSNNFTLGLKYISGTIESVPSDSDFISIKGDDGNMYSILQNVSLNFEKGQKVKVLYNSISLPNSQYDIEIQETYPLQIKTYAINIEKE